MYLSDVQTKEIVSVALKFLRVMNNKYFCSERWIACPQTLFPFFIYLTPAESKNQAEQENEHKAWEKRKGVFVNIIGEKEVYIFMFSTHRYTHSMLYYIYANLLVTFLRKVGKSE